MNFEGQIQEWISLDNQLKELNDKIKGLRDKRNSLEQNITNYASTNNLSNATIKISDGKLKFVETKVPECLTFKYLDKTLREVIKNENQVIAIMEHIKQKRNIKVITEIKRFSNN